jgi:hypothetical protein
MLLFAVAANAIECLALLIATIPLFRSHCAQRQQVEALHTFLLRNIQPEELIKFKSTLERLFETELKNLLASRSRPPETNTRACSTSHVDWSAKGSASLRGGSSTLPNRSAT